MRFARWTFLLAALYGLAVTVPPYVLAPPLPAIASPEHYFGFFGAAAAMQLVYLVIARDPVRYRPLILTGVASKLSFAGPLLWLYALGRIGPLLLAAGLTDLALVILFLVARARIPVQGRP